MRVVTVPTDGICRQCGRAVAGMRGEFWCQECREREKLFDRSVSAVYYEELAGDLINGYKFSGKLHLLPDLTDWLEAAVRVRYRLSEIDLVVAMPSMVWHRFLRGYNQCDYLARELARRIGVRYLPRAMRRIGQAHQQAGLSEQARIENVKGTFKVLRPSAIANRTILLIDDIMTTGSTLSECARALKQSAAARVWVATLAQTNKLR